MRALWMRLFAVCTIVIAVATVAPVAPPERVAAAGTVRWGYYVTYAADSLTSAKANVDNLTHVSPYFYTVRPDGTINTRAEQESVTALLRARGVKIVPMIKNDATYDAFRAMLDTPEKRARLVDAIVALVQSKNYDGIHIDFEGLNGADRPILTDFMTRLYARLSAAGKLTTIAVAAKDRDVTTGWAGAYDYAALARASDLVTLMAYDYNWVNDPTPGPVAPLPWVRRVATFAASQFGPGKVLLGIPFYGFDWNTTTGPPARSLRMDDGLALARLQGATSGYSEADQATWVRYTAPNGDKHEAWFEDERSIAAKLQVVTDLGLGGFAGWRLGHENGAAWSAIKRMDTPATRVAPVPDTSDQVYFAETGHVVSGEFLRYWRQYGGLAQFGLPRTEVFWETSPYDNQQYQVQYFERARFELHPNNPPPFNVLLGLLGRDFRAIDPAVAPKPGQRYFPETGHNVGGAFLEYWLTHGGLFVSGLPISEEFTEISPDDGQPYTVQYFERARYEFHPNTGGRPYIVLLGLLGNRVIQGRGWIP